MLKIVLTMIIWDTALRSRFAHSLLPDLDPYGGNDSNEMVSLVYKQGAQELILKLVILSKHLIKGVVCRYVGD